MSIALEKTQNRTYLKRSGKRVKIIPKQFLKIPTRVINRAIVENKKLRLSSLEKFNLKYIVFKENLKKTEPYIFQLIEKLEVMEVRKVTIRDQQIPRYEAVFNNSYYIKISKSLYDLHPNKSTKHSNF